MGDKKTRSTFSSESSDKPHQAGRIPYLAPFLVALLIFSCSLFCLPNFAGAELPNTGSLIGDTVTNPLIEPADPPTAPPNNETTVTGLDMSLSGGDPIDYTQFVFTGVSGIPGNNEFSFMVRGDDEKIYQYFAPIRYEFTITSILNSPTPYTSPQVTISRQADGETVTADFDAWQTYNEWLSMFAINTDPTPPDDSFGSGGPNGVSYVRYGSLGGNGHHGALFVPPGDGKPGGTGPTIVFKTMVAPSPLLGLDPAIFPLTAINAVNKVGLFVASIGGKGGNGGNSYASFWSAGDGANGGKGGNVTLLNNTPTTITTSGDKTGLHGIYVLSRSGKGGTGGSGYGAPGGGSGGGSLDGGNVTIVNGSDGNIQTNSAHSYGILGLSVSGTGGSGGDQYGIWGDAGDGGGAANGGDVKITNAGGTVITRQEGSFAIIAQSIGGTGGSSGDSGNLIYSGDANAKNGGNGGMATIINEGQVFTEGKNSPGLAAQSIGGGGGNSGSSWGLVAIGGTADDGGTGDAVSVQNTSTGLVQTLGNGSTGIFAQSVGGSGGRGGNAGGLVAIGGDGAVGGAGGTVDVTNAGVIKTFGNGSRGIFAESVGGGGGSGGSTVGMVSVGGTGVGGGDGNNVTVINSGTITTAGDYSEGIYAQSVGGGGGDGGTSTAVGLFAAVGIGGDGGKGGNGGVVDVTLGGGSPSIIKTGNDEDGGYKSVGLFAQSVGGGGGTGGGAMAASFGLYASVSVALGGDGGTGGDGGKVNLTTEPDSQNTIVSTKGDHSTGIYLQSVGGGGGDGGYAYSMAAAAGDVGSLTVNVGIGGDGNAGGIGGEVNVGSGFTANPTIDDLPTSPTSGFKGAIFTDGARSTGLFAQSVGGGGGNGGLAISAGISASAGASLGVSVGLGGDGGAAGDGGVVKVATEGDITTNQAQSTALLAQSVGGGGGNGGGTVAAGVAASAGAAASINVGGGGDGAAGGKGGEVTLVTGEGNILTKGVRLPDPELDPVVDAELLARIEGGQSPGIIVQSVGGGGGNGGYAVAAGVAGAGAAAGGVTVGLGGGGGSGGDGGKVFAQMASNVTTEGDSSPAILAQSVGGGGGNGGFSVSVAGGGAGTAAGAVSVGLGGEGAVGGKGGEVIASSAGEIITEGFQSAGFTAQSIGGGGGNGGFNVSIAGAGSGAAAGSVSVGLGGSAGKGGDSGLVTALSSGNVSTKGDQSIGILAQSIGGGGGNGGFNVSSSGAGAGAGAGAVSVGLGGSGEAGGDGNTVLLTVQKDVSTEGDSSTAVVAQSIGGGGGNGGFNVSASASGAGTGSGAVSVGLGGSGSSGGKGKTVIVSSSGDILTMGADSGGILAQSIGGGGGNGGFNIAASLSGAGVGSGGVAVGLGGEGGSGGLGGDVNASSYGTITTLKNNSAAFIAQSIGGGGGNGGFNVAGSLSGAGTGSGSVNVGLGGSGGLGSDSGTVTGLVTGKIWTSGVQSTGVLAQSVGGGGGNGGFNVTAGGSGAGTGSGTVSVGLGGDGAGGGQGGSVNLTVSETVFTGGAQSGAVIAQSIGGGGGNGGFNVSAAASGAGTGSGTVGVGLGGSGAGGGDGGAVVLSTSGDILTKGFGSGGILAQSVGGGGGNGGFNISVSGSGAGTGSGAVAVGLGGSGAGGGHGSTVNLTVANNVTTMLKDSSGIVAQSIGGGGGNGGFDVTVAGSGAGTGSGAVSVGLGGSAGTGGFASTVTSRVTGDIVTGGDFSTGLLVQSVGGGGGNGGFSVSAAISGAGTGSGSAAVGLGGSGGGGGLSGKVKSTLTGDVTTSGKNASAVIAQSIGGGGGNGGLTVAGAISAAKTGSGAASVSIGGSGGGGGNANTVDNTVTGKIVTSETGSGGVLAQSVGGGGGNGGISISGTISAAGTGSGAVSVGIGGSGGDGGTSMKVTNRVTGNVQTLGDNSTGILAQSLGGGGGNGGLNVTGMITAAKTGSGSLAVGVGGFGGDGGNAADVANEVIGGTVTTGNNADGIVAQSLGGGGGNGAINVTASLNFTKENGGTLGVGIGGFGGGGGNAGNVTSAVTTTTDYNQIGTTGSNSSAVIAQSIGGGGGNGGLNVTGAVNATGKNGAAIGIGVGGFGGGAGNAGNVTLGVSGPVVTEGNNSHGLIAQSIGGGGGNGGTNITGSLAITKPSKGTSATTVAASIGIGGFGGGGGKAGNVDVDYTGTIVAQPRVLVPEAFDLVSSEIIPEHYEFREGVGSHGILAQSLGGGGGNGGINVSAGISYAAKKGDGHALLIGVGGFGGTGGNAGSVDVTIEGDESVSAYGAGHSAVMAQSAGGGGGSGGLNVSGGIVSDSALIVGVGGLGGNGGRGGDVSVDAKTDVYASAADSRNLNSAGILAQSLGGGGGNGGLNVSGGLSLSKEKDVPSITVGVGGFGGSGAVSGDVDVDHTGLAMTSGNWIHGIMAQSIAGGGGNGALNVSSQINWADSKNSGGNTDLTIVAGIGGHGGAGANAGDVAVVSSGEITTSGDNARGIFAQSIGGGGGNGGMNVTGVFAKNSSPVSIGVGGFGSGGGNAGEVSVTRGSTGAPAGLISTDGVGSIGIEASSIGGGGGDAGMNFIVGISLAGSSKKSSSSTRKHPKHTGVDESVFKNFDKVLDELKSKFPKDDQDKKDANKESAFAAQIAIGGAGGEAGHGDAVTVDNFGDIVTNQSHSHGIMGQSIGGGGGNANLNLAVTYQGKSDKNKGFNLAIGGAPGDGGNGGKVDVNHDGFIETMGDNSYGILSQSIGGGGGNAGLDFAYSKSGGKIGITLGRRGGTGGYGDDVTLSSKGSVITHGNRSFGLLAQSIGNGGGNSSSSSFSISTPAGDESPSRAASLSVGLEGGVGGGGGNVSLDAEGWVSTDGENAHAIFAQSVGGGGGNGGSASGFAFLSSTAALSIGGTGGTGGIGGTVDVVNSADVRTNNRDSIGILAQSVGGGGGTGGMVKSGGLQTKGSGALVAIGGAGGSGMAGGLVTVDNSGVVITDGENSHGVLAQSLGGGGGNSGMVINTIYNQDASKATQISVSVGGSGGDGAVSKAVEVTNTGGIGTNLENSIGIFAQSLGGGGGNASTVITGSISGKGAGNKISIGIGGSGGTGGAAGSVTVANLKDESVDSGEIITLGNYSHGILAMSIGGGGGTGSTTITANKSGGEQTKSSSYSLAFSLGGAGGTGGTGGDVDVTNSGEITTYGYKAHGISALSVGGGGGSGGMSIAGDLSKGATSKEDSKNKACNIAIGGFGGSGNTSGDVTINNSGSIVVFGDRSYGIYAQSVGGGGGDGGFSTTLSRNLITNPKSNLKLSSLLNIGVGGSGGNGADSGNVLVEHTGSITAHGDNSYGIFAQSIGGGGGNVGSSITNPAWMAVDYTVSNLLGVREGSKGKAGTVTINTSGDIVMLGANSQAQFAQSVNGGGGNMDFFLDVSQQAVELGDDGFELPDNSGDVDKAIAFVTQYIELGTTAVKDAVGSAIDATHVGDLYTAGKESIGSLIQTIGGGGGSENAEIVVDSQANVDLVLALGGAESSNSSGGNVKLTRKGNIGTSGDKSQGAGVQSIGGGGGNLTVNVRKVPVPEEPASVAASSTPVPFATLAAPMTEASEAAGSSTATVMLGSDSGDNNDGGDMNLTYTGDLSTAGDLSPGLIVQSIGAGGGQVHLTGLDSLEISIGATNDSSGNGGNVAVSNEGSIVTEGELSHGIMIQSIGGGGGVAITDLDESAVNLTLNNDNSGNGGSIDFEQTGDIVVSGDRSIGVFAQSLGGGGGVVDRFFADTAGGEGSSGAITLNLDGNIQALGQEGVAVFAQSRSSEAQGDISVTLNSGKRLNFGAGGVGVWFAGGADNRFVNNGIAAGEDGLLGWVVRGEEGDEAVENHSTFLGQFDLGTGINSFTNHPGQLFVPGPVLVLGDDANLLEQHGVMMPGDMLHAQRTDLTGSFQQSSTGLTYAEIDFDSENPNVDGGLIDSIYASGTVDLDGELKVSLVNPQLVPYGSFQKTLFQGDLGLTDHGIVMTTAPSVVIHYDLIHPDSDAVFLDYSVDFSPEGMGQNLSEVGNYFNRIQAAGSSPELADTVIKLLDDPDMETYSQSLSQLSPEFYGELQAEQIRRSQRLTQVMADGGEYRFVKKDRVVWFNFEREINEQDAYDDLKGAKHYTNRFAVGLEKMLNGKWTAGFGLSLEDNESDSYQKQWTSDGDAFYLGALLKRKVNDTLFDASMSYGWGESGVERHGELTESFTAKANLDYGIFGGMLRVSHEFNNGRAYIRPAFGLGVTHLSSDSASETGADAISLALEGIEETYTWMRPAIGFGYQRPFKNDWKIQLHAGLGYHYYFSDAETMVSAGFTGAPPDVEPMSVIVDFDQSYTLGAIEVDLLTSRDISIGLHYSKVIGDRSDVDRWGANLKIPF